MIPGANILGMALSVIAPQTVQYRRYLSRATNAAGLDVSAYADPVPVRGSIQPVPRSRYEVMGLDFAKTYWTLRAPLAALGVARDASGDQVIYDGKLLQVESATDWHDLDGWSEALCVEIGNEG